MSLVITLPTHVIVPAARSGEVTQPVGRSGVSPRDQQFYDAGRHHEAEEQAKTNRKRRVRAVLITLAVALVAALVTYLVCDSAVPMFYWP